MPYIFTKDFPPTDYKKGDLYEYEQSHFDFYAEEIALLLHLGIIEEVNVDKPWPQAADYWYFEEDGKTYNDVWFDRGIDNYRLAFGNVFRTEKQAEEARDKVRKLLKKEI